MGISWEYRGNIVGISWKYHGNIMGIWNNSTKIRIQWIGLKESLQETIVVTTIFKEFNGIMRIFHGIENEPTRYDTWVCPNIGYTVYGPKLQFHRENDRSPSILGILCSDRSVYC